MPPKLFVDLEKVDMDKVIAGPEEIRKYNPQRYEFEQLEAIVLFDADAETAVGYKDLRDDEFWVRGHIPGRPLFPGVLMCESAAQICSYYFKKYTDTDKFLGFGGLDNVKFRGQVKPGDRFIVIAKKLEIGRRRAVFDCQGVVNGKLVFQGTVTGMPM